MLIIISGPPAAGKTTISEKLAKKFPRSVHLSKDFIYHLVENGRFAPWDRTKEAKKQFALNEKIIKFIIQTYLNDKYVVIAEGVFGDNSFREYKRLFKTVKAFTLLPSLRVMQNRDKKRSKEKQIPHRLKPLHEAYTSNKNENFMLIDNSRHSIEKTVNLIYSSLK